MQLLHYCEHYELREGCIKVGKVGIKTRCQSSLKKLRIHCKCIHKEPVPNSFESGWRLDGYSILNYTAVKDSNQPNYLIIGE